MFPPRHRKMALKCYPNPRPNKEGVKLHVRSSLPGSALTVQETQRFAQANATFFKLPTSAGERLGKRVTRAFVIPDHTATLHLMRRLRSAVKLATAWRLEEYIPDYVQLKACAGRATTDALVRFAPNITANLDQAGTNVSIIQFLPYHTWINVVYVYDPVAHRVNNDVNNNVEEAKLAGLIYKSAPLLNFRRGPCQSIGHDRECREMAVEASRYFRKNDRVLIVLWPRICRAMG